MTYGQPHHRYTAWTPSRMAATALLAAAGIWCCLGGSPRAVAGELPRFDRNALFINQYGAPVYYVGDLRPSSFLGVPAVVGVFTEGLPPIAFAATPTNNPAVWVWLTAGGPAGILEFHPGPQPYVTWKDNRGNWGYLVTF